MGHSLSWFLSLLIHAAAISLLWVLILPTRPLIRPLTPHGNLLIVVERAPSPRGVPKRAPALPSQGSDRVARGSGDSPRKKRFDLRPGFVKGGLPIAEPEQSKPSAPGVDNPTSRDLLLSESKVFHAFDQLAERINRYLDYPALLAENGVQGIARLDLFFDQEGNIDEARSFSSGDNRAVRGLLVQASRKGLIEWFRNEASRLRKEQFQNQHFRADFVVTQLTTGLAEISKPSPDSYRFLRRRSLNGTCIAGTPDGGAALNLACFALRVAGAVNRRVDDRYSIRYQALIDRLEQLDQLGLGGIRAEIRGKG